jgi:transposase-like protein
MNCPSCGSNKTSESSPKTSLGYRTYSCSECQRRFNERSGTPFNNLQFPVKVGGKWHYLYRAIDRAGNLIDSMLSATRDMAAAKRFFKGAKEVTGCRPERVTTDGHGSYPRAIRSVLGRKVVHRTNQVPQ